MENNIYQKLQNVRVKVGEQCTRKSGHNAYAGFDYFTLDDFLPIANRCFAEVGLCPVFSIIPKTKKTTDGEYSEIGDIAQLQIFAVDGSSVEFISPLAEAIVGKNQNPIQNLGAQHTYMKRYLYMNALELSEGDIIDATSGKEDKTEKYTPATIEQVDKIMEIYDSENIQKIKEVYHVDNIEKLSAQQASQVIAHKKKVNERN